MLNNAKMCVVQVLIFVNDFNYHQQKPCFGVINHDSTD
jgi:hypothetical protein